MTQKTWRKWVDGMYSKQELEIYHQGYKQGRFDERAERMEQDRTESDKQKRCPYCHDEKPILTVDDEIQVYVDNSVADKNLSLTYDFEKEAINDKQFVNSPFGAKWKKINYCPMCGRKLNREDDND